MCVTWLWGGGGTCVNPHSPLSGGNGPSCLIISFSAPHRYALHKEAVLFVLCCKCQTYRERFICISGCTQRAQTLTAYGLDVR